MAHPGVKGLGTASLLADAGHEMPTALLPSLLTSTLGAPAMPERLVSGYRTYTPATVERIRLARRLQGLGLTLDEVIDALHVTDRGDATCESERWRLEAVLERIDDQLAELQATRREIRRVMAACDAGACTFASVEDARDPA